MSSADDLEPPKGLTTKLTAWGSKFSPPWYFQAMYLAQTCPTNKK